MTKTILITGANGEVGHGLIRTLGEQDYTLLAVDMRPLDDALAPYIAQSWVGDILDKSLMQSIFEAHPIDIIFHMAAMLSTSAERLPMQAHQVNVGGTLNLLELAQRSAEQRNTTIKFMFPSSIAVYGIPSVSIKASLPPVDEDTHLHPITMYGVTKLHCEELGRYYMNNLHQLNKLAASKRIDFRGLRFPGLISADTTPSGGTSDYGPEMLHAAAQGQPYAAFVRPDTKITFMAMPDAITALLMLANAPREQLSRPIYNINGFSLSAEEIAQKVQTFFPDADIRYEPHAGRQKIVDSWPAEVNDRAARTDWGWQPTYDAVRAFSDYLVPAISRRYRIEQNA